MNKYSDEVFEINNDDTVVLTHNGMYFTSAQDAVWISQADFEKIIEWYQSQK